MQWRASWCKPALGAAFIGLLCSPAWAGEAAWVARINGAPLVRRAGKVLPLARGDRVDVGDTIETDATAKAKILLADDSILTIGPRSRVTLQEFLLETGNRSVRLDVLVGRFKLAVAKFFGGNSRYDVGTPTAVAGVRGTVLWGDTELDAICALDGRIEVRSRLAPNPAEVASGACVNQMGAGKTAPLEINAEKLAVFLKEVTLD